MERTTEHHWHIAATRADEPNYSAILDLLIALETEPTDVRYCLVEALQAGDVPASILAIVPSDAQSFASFYLRGDNR